MELRFDGRVPDWLRGTLIRNGPGLWQLGRSSVGHWFDGLAKLHAFHLNGSRMVYRSRFLRSPEWQGLQSRGCLTHPQFASDPCRSLFKKFASMFLPEVGCNANVNIARLGQRYLALTETPMALEFDPETLETLGLYDYDNDGFRGPMTSAHPVLDDGELFNFTVCLGRQSGYRGFRTRLGPRQEFARCPTQRPSYLHSCALTSKEMLLWEGPFVVNPLHLLWRERPYIQNYRWKPELGSRLLRLGRNGDVSTQELPPLFVFHLVQAFYRDSDLCLDMLAYPDASVIDQLYLDPLLRGGEVAKPLLTRCRGGRVEVLSSTPLELPRTFEGFGQEYQAVYGIGCRQGPFYDSLVRVEPESGDSLEWFEPGCFPGEPVPVIGPAPGDRLLLSVVLDEKREQSFLLALDERLGELGRAYVPAIVPFGFHGGLLQTEGSPASSAKPNL